MTKLIRVNDCSSVPRFERRDADHLHRFCAADVDFDNLRKLRPQLWVPQTSTLRIKSVTTIRPNVEKPATAGFCLLVTINSFSDTLLESILLGCLHTSKRQSCRH